MYENNHTVGWLKYRINKTVTNASASNFDELCDFDKLFDELLTELIEIKEHYNGRLSLVMWDNGNQMYNGYSLTYQDETGKENFRHLSFKSERREDIDGQ